MKPAPAPAPPRATHGLRTLLVAALAAVVAVPVAFIITVLLHPFWSWLEATTGLESMGRHGPAPWCFVAVWGLTVLATLLPAAVRRLRPGPRAEQG